MADTVKGTEAFIRKRLGGRYSLERLKNIPDGSIHNIFKALSKKKGISIQEIYKKAGKQLDITKVHTQNEYLPFMVSKKVVGVRAFFSEPKIGLLFIPLNINGKNAEIQTFAFKGYEPDFKKIRELLPTLTLVSIEKDFEDNLVPASDSLSFAIKHVLGIGYNVKGIDLRNIPNVLNKLTEKGWGDYQQKFKDYAHNYAALLVSERIHTRFRTGRKICLLLVPQKLDFEKSSTDAIVFEGMDDAYETIWKKLRKNRVSNLKVIAGYVPQKIEVPAEYTP